MSLPSKRFIITSCITLAVVIPGIGLWRREVVAKRSKISIKTIQQGVGDGDFVSARSALQGLADPVQRREKEREIRTAELQHALEVRDTGLIRMAMGNEGGDWMDPKIVESADLELAREAVHARDFASYDACASKWKGKSAAPGRWLLLEADQLLAHKLPEDALKLLKGTRLPGAEDALRLVRIALLESKEPWKAMTTIDEGLIADPRNADLLSFRAQIEEAAGRMADARLDYVAAVLSERRNPLYRDILANFYLRTGDTSAAAETWRDAALDTGLGVYAFKSWFWSRMSGARLTPPVSMCREKNWREIVAKLSETGDDRFWSESLDAAISTIRGGGRRPEVAWLKVLEAIRTNDIQGARKQLESGFPRDADQLCPGLVPRLLAHLAAVDGGDARTAIAGRAIPEPAAGAHPMLEEFATWARNPGKTPANARFESWLAQPQSVVGILMASGWPGAALIAGKGEHLRPAGQWPEWFDYGYAKSILGRDGKESARAWLEGLPSRGTAAELLLGEIQLTSGATEQGLERLRTIASTGSMHAARAAWTLALAELDRGKPAAAREIVRNDPALAGSVQGSEILARAALAEGSKDETLRIYQELGEKSADAMIYLSKEAFAAGDFEDARKWTGALARRFPEQPAFRKNLLKIDETDPSRKP